MNLSLLRSNGNLWNIPSDIICAKGYISASCWQRKEHSLALLMKYVCIESSIFSSEI